MFTDFMGILFWVIKYVILFTAAYYVIKFAVKNALKEWKKEELLKAQVDAAETSQE